MKILIPNNQLTRLPVLLAQVKAGNNQVIIIIGDNKRVITTEPKTFCLDLPKDAGINLKYEIYKR